MTEKKWPKVGIGLLGGTGLYRIEGLEVLEEIEMETPFGKPSDAYILGALEGQMMAFLSRHGRGHPLLPSDINYRANIYGFKMLGVERVIATNSVGSLREELKPRDIVFADQFFDRTYRSRSFFGEGIAAHISFAEPVCGELSQVLLRAGQDLGLTVHPKGTYICIEGPQFSTKAESRVYRSWGCDVIGMTGVTEAKLCREAEMCYAPMCLVTDYDVWHETEETVTIEMIIENVQRNIQSAKAILKKAITMLPPWEEAQCGCSEALGNCIVTQRDRISKEAKERLRHIIGKYV